MAPNKEWPWPSIKDVEARLPKPVPDGLQLCQMKRSDVHFALVNLPKWYPDIETGTESCHLTSDFYDDQVQFAGELQQSNLNIFPMLMQKINEPLFFLTVERKTLAKNLIARLAIVAPQARGTGLAYYVPWLLEALGRAMCAGLVYYHATLKTPQQQRVAEKAGFTLVGIMPAYDIDTLTPNSPKRVFEAIYAKVLASPEQVLVPNNSALTPNTINRMNQIFGKI